MSKVKFGVNINTREPLIYPDSYSIDELFDFAQRCEELGYGSVWVGDSILEKRRMDPLLTLSSVAMRTKKVKLGTCCLIAALRNPVLLARAWATLDVISHGRTMMGVCIGPNRQEYQQIGIRPKNRSEMLDELLLLVQRLWTEEKVSHSGRYYQVSDVVLEPKPVQKPRPSVYLVGWPYGDGKNIDEEHVASMLTRVASHSDGWMLNGGTTPELLGQGVERLRQLRKSEGKGSGQPEEVIFQPTLNIDDDATKAEADSNEYILKYYGTLKRSIQVFGVGGGADAIIDYLQAYVSAGVTTFVLRFASPHQFVQLERFTTEVLPSFST